MTTEFNLIRFQDELIDTLNRTWKNGRRAQPKARAAIRKARATLVNLGWSKDQAGRVVEDATDVWSLAREAAGPRLPYHTH